MALFLLKPACSRLKKLRVGEEGTEDVEAILEDEEPPLLGPTQSPYKRKLKKEQRSMRPWILMEGIGSTP